MHSNGASFQNTGYVSGVPHSTEPKTAYLPALNPTKDKQKFPFFISVSQILTKKIQFYSDGAVYCLRHIKEFFVEQSKGYVGQAQYIPVYTTSENKEYIN
jgi:hypothetical protein